MRGVPPFPSVRESLEKLASKADVIVVSSTPAEALSREWEENDIAKYAAIIAGQEMGSKKEHLQLTTDGKYKPAHILMIGDAPGDVRAARAVDARFYPIIPGEEEASWERFHNDIIDTFLGGRYAEALEEKLLTRFEQALPTTPSWA